MNEIKKSDEKLSEVKRILKQTFSGGGIVSSFEEFERFAHAWFNHGFILGKNFNSEK